MTTRADAYAEGRIATGARAACGHLAPCGCRHWTGCCTHCPLPHCLLDSQSLARRAANASRDAEIAACRDAGASVREIEGRLGLSRRTVFRILADHNRSQVSPR